MQLAANILVALIAVLHVYILILEMFMWNKPRGLKAFGLDQRLADETVSLAANQGLYNGFLAAGLVFGLVYPHAPANAHIQIFFLVCVMVAGIYGAATAKKQILFIQTVPALIALIAVLLA
ncbi:DUF1304 domain-containing protein [Saccharibacillus sp. CPCC 101409]|uniref:DUF1304 domain-containing protein n=1 Tax=Saccharibacillus sp. CPCC 101409 TaxID=3058041 RepID=UPI002672EE1A|nr:DUF1304 domain-containing protein [Saccharibacillus sp. CPCC 101409]MDO3408783.1 DUF1304 domain-containing protein [Saccharibacillus sp. CPCC 101409]